MIRVTPGKQMWVGFQRKLLYVLLALAGVLGMGTLGSVVILKLSPVGAFFYTIITISTVGSFTPENIHNSNAGMLLTVFLIFAGVGLLLYAFSAIMTFVVEGELTDILRRKRVQKEIDRLKEHYIVSGAGDTGRHVIEEFIRTKLPFVVIEKDKSRLEKIAPLEKLLFVEGDATDDAALIAAGVHRAAGLVAALGHDNDNLVVVVSARTLNARLRIVSRLVEDSCRYKLRRAGANAVVSADMIGGLRIASEMIRPVTVSFLDTMLRSQEESYRVSEAEVTPSSELVGKILKEARIPNRTGVLVIALRSADTGKFIYNPTGDSKIGAGDFLIVISTAAQLAKLKELASP